MFENFATRNPQYLPVLRSKLRQRMQTRAKQLKRTNVYKITVSTVKVVSMIIFPAWDSFETRPKQPKVTAHGDDGGLLGYGGSASGYGTGANGGVNGGKMRRRRSWESLVDGEF